MAYGDAFVSALLIAYGVYLYLGAEAIRVLPTYSRIGPRFFPYLVAAGTFVCGVLLLIQALRGQRGAPEAGEDVDVTARDNLRPVLVIAVALALGTLLMEPAGYVLASAVLFTGVALGFGSRRTVRDAGVGLVLALTTYLAFTRLLDLNLPAGILPLLTTSLGL